MHFVQTYSTGYLFTLDMSMKRIHILGMPLQYNMPHRSKNKTNKVFECNSSHFRIKNYFYGSDTSYL